MSEPDHVTRLASRSELQRMLDRLTAAGTLYALVVCDVVGLKATNEREGFHAGDTRLRAAADRLREIGGEALLLARLGGDELVAVCGDVAAAARIIADLARPGIPEIRAAADVRRPDEPADALVDRLYATLRRC